MDIVRPKIISDGISFRETTVSLEHDGTEFSLPVLSLEVSADPNDYVLATFKLAVASVDISAGLRGRELRVMTPRATSRAKYSNVELTRDGELVRARSLRWTFDGSGPARIWLEGEN